MPPCSLLIVRRSPIHGRGVFARQQIRKGALLGEYLGEETRRDGRYVLWLEDEEGNLTGIRGRNELRFVNHSAEPNVAFSEVELFALRRIEAGEELTADYGEEWAEGAA